MLRMTRAATAFTLLIDVGCTGPAATAMERLLLKRQQILSAAQGIDGANGRSVKAGASPTIFSSLTVDSDGRPAASGTNLAGFHLKLQTLNFPSAPLWQESLEVLRKSNLFGPVRWMDGGPSPAIPAASTHLHWAEPQYLTAARTSKHMGLVGTDGAATEGAVTWTTAGSISQRGAEAALDRLRTAVSHGRKL